MKIAPDHFRTLSHAIHQARQGMDTLDEYVRYGLTAKRWRWDLLWRAKRLGFLPERFIEDNIYTYANDDHIDTALRRITAKA
jgi:phosphatidylserine/phosphatidylglycerophosphate/cardiolipin synthase-like enzyme